MDVRAPGVCHPGDDPGVLAQEVAGRPQHTFLGEDGGGDAFPGFTCVCIHIHIHISTCTNTHFT